MSSFDPEKLTVSCIPPSTRFRPVHGRRYTLTRCNITDSHCLHIGYDYHINKDEKKRDQVLAEWIPQMGQIVLWVKVFVDDGQDDEQSAKIRFMIFKKETSQALKAFVNGDQQFYVHFPWLLDSPIYLQFESAYRQFQQVNYMGTPRQYIAKPIKQPVS
ncbi:hypothetical protein H1Z61_16320 [Bacillus aquiflavi]|uniref:Staygreen protein domain-containing protein n=1 Tax=Bacillus aquiflavi TaxID=2672567 RepID=A0A6B3W0I1_9BACI|nr:staygreen family protein [Bacillus aquiflavi]MBA4538648.1 hypothetical protein [Bacillus aquiflavi]NEY83008.1 hypothetical protein [Bacillus aquiflavi]UAC49581.1 staygreen family protein [Bacillus aquiflavi]